MKINWGVGITALYLGFVAMILLLVSMSIGQKIDLVTEHYYEEEIGFQDKINKKQRASALSTPVTWTVSEKGINITFPESFKDSDLSGEVRLYCPSNDKNDRKFSLVSSGHRQHIKTSDVPVGTYHLQIDWKNSDQAYWNEDVITISHAKDK